MSNSDHKWGELGYKAQDIKRGTLDVIFFSPGEHRLRAGWRILAQLFIFWLISWFWIILLRISPAAFGDDQLLLMLREIGKAVSFTISVFVARKIIDERSLQSLGLKFDRWTILDFFSGLGIALVLVGAVILLILFLGAAEIRGLAWQTDTPQNVALNIFGTFLIFVLVGWSEELLFRGYYLQTIAEGSNIVWGVLLSSMLFGYLHIYNQGATWETVFIIFLSSIFLEAYAYLITKQLWLAIGLHVGLDFFGVLFFGNSLFGLHIFHLTELVAKEAGLDSPYIDIFVNIFMPILGGILLYQYSKIIRKYRSISNPLSE
jgi:membrane protease YdiL (CAAX protease family)